MKKERQGEIFILLQAVLWGLFPIFVIWSFVKLSPLESLGWTSLSSAIFFSFILTARRGWKDLKNKEAIKDIVWATLFLGIFYYVFYYFGLKYTSPGNATIIAQMEILTSYLFFQIWKKEYIPRQHVIGAILMLIGGVIVLFPKTTGFRIGDLLILSAVFFAPFGNYFQVRARKKVSSESILFLRSMISGIIVLLFAYGFRISDFSAPALKDSWKFLALNGIFLMGLSKIFWIEGVHRISVTKANALGALTPVLTLLFAFMFLREAPSFWQLISIVPMFFGILLLSKE